MTNTSPQSTEAFFKNAFQQTTLEEERKSLLEAIASQISEAIENGNTVNLNFICTHNSRRSQLAQVWAHYAADFFGLNAIKSYSGGTAVTAFFRNTVKTLQEAGFVFEIESFSHDNPVYRISYEGCSHPAQGYSKRFDDKANPQPFIAITTCNSADESCPVIPEAEARFHLPYTDPKGADGTPEQSEAYLKANRTIAGEIFYIFQKIAKDTL